MGHKLNHITPRDHSQLLFFLVDGGGEAAGAAVQNGEQGWGHGTACAAFLHPHHPQHSVVWGTAGIEKVGICCRDPLVSIPSIAAALPSICLPASPHSSAALAELLSCICKDRGAAGCPSHSDNTEPKLRARVTLICTHRLQNETQVSAPGICLAPAGGT